jgi:hypothetical protein
MNGRSREAHLRFAERRRREDEARRLHDEVPQLRTLKLEVEEHRREATIAETSSCPATTRRVVMAVTT